jgi:hypothetical protein
MKAEVMQISKCANRAEFRPEPTGPNSLAERGIHTAPRLMREPPPVARA